MGARLLDRSVAGTSLTPTGEVVLRHALRILQAVDSARRDVEALRQGAVAPIRIAGFSTACTYIVPGAAGRLRDRRPAVEFTLEDCDSADAVEMVRHGRADLAVAFDYASHPLDLAGVEAQHLGDDVVRVAINQRHPAAGRAVVRIADLAEEPWISGTGFGCRESLMTVCGVAGFSPVIAFDSNRYPTTLALVAAGHGIALVPATALGHLPPGVAVQTLRPAPMPRRLWAVTAEPADGALRELVDELVAELRY